MHSIYAIRRTGCEHGLRAIRTMKQCRVHDLVRKEEPTQNEVAGQRQKAISNDTQAISRQGKTSCCGLDLNPRYYAV